MTLFGGRARASTAGRKAKPATPGAPATAPGPTTAATTAPTPPAPDMVLTAENTAVKPTMPVEAGGTTVQRRAGEGNSGSPNTDPNEPGTAPPPPPEYTGPPATTGEKIGTAPASTAPKPPSTLGALGASMARAAALRARKKGAGSNALTVLGAGGAATPKVKLRGLTLLGR